MTNHIWQDGDEYKLEPITAPIITNAEQQLKVKLPESYLSLLEQQNGGYIIYNAYPTDTPTSWADDHIHIDHIRGIGENDGILESAYFIEEWELPSDIVLISGDGHSWIALDYRQVSVEPSVIYIDTEVEQTITVAKDFDEFLSRLYIEEYADIEDYEDSEAYTLEDLDAFIVEDNIEKMLHALMDVVQSDVDTALLSTRLLQLSAHQDSRVRTEIGDYVWSRLTNALDEKVLNELLATFENDQDPDVQMMAELISEKINYPFENFVEEVELSNQACFFYKGAVYIVNTHSDLWHISDSETDLQTFNTFEELLEQATLEGIPLKEKWNEVRGA